jgi:hypothetical protein
MEEIGYINGTSTPIANSMNRPMMIAQNAKELHYRRVVANPERKPHADVSNSDFEEILPSRSRKASEIAERAAW